MLHFLKLIKYTVLLYFESSDLSAEMVGGLKRKSLTKCRVYPRLKTISKTFLEKLPHKSVSAQQTCCTFVLHNYFVLI